MDAFRNAAERKEDQCNWMVMIRMRGPQNIIPDKGAWASPRKCFPHKSTWKDFLISKGVTLPDPAMYCVEALRNRKKNCVRYGLETKVAELLGNYKVLQIKKPYAVFLKKRKPTFNVVDSPQEVVQVEDPYGPYVLPDVGENLQAVGNPELHSSGGTVFINVGQDDHQRGILGQHNPVVESHYNLEYIPLILSTPVYTSPTIVQSQPVFHTMNFGLMGVSLGYGGMVGYYELNGIAPGLEPVVAEVQVQTEPSNSYFIKDENSQQGQEVMVRGTPPPLDLRLRSKRPPKGFLKAALAKPFLGCS